MVRQVIGGVVLLGGYYAAVLALLLALRALARPAPEIFRKLLHIACMLSVPLMLYGMGPWQVPFISVLVIAAVSYPALGYLERYPRLMAALVQKHPGEIRRTLTAFFLVTASMLAVFWGLLGEGWRFAAAAAMLAWGFGDAAAALAGKAWGRHFITHRWVEPGKTAEGSLAMLAVSFAAVLIALLALGSLPWQVCLMAALLTAPICSAVELLSHGGWDTVTVPLSASACIYLLVRLL